MTTEHLAATKLVKLIRWSEVLTPHQISEVLETSFLNDDPTKDFWTVDNNFGLSDEIVRDWHDCSKTLVPVTSNFYSLYKLVEGDGTVVSEDEVDRIFASDDNGADNVLMFVDTSDNTVWAIEAHIEQYT